MNTGSDPYRSSSVFVGVSGTDIHHPRYIGTDLPPERQVCHVCEKPWPCEVEMQRRAAR